MPALSVAVLGSMVAAAPGVGRERGGPRARRPWPAAADGPPSRARLDDGGPRCSPAASGASGRWPMRSRRRCSRRRRGGRSTRTATRCATSTPRRIWPEPDGPGHTKTSAGGSGGRRVSEGGGGPRGGGQPSEGIVSERREGGSAGLEAKRPAELCGGRRDPIAEVAPRAQRGRRTLSGLGPERLEVVVDVHDGDGVHWVYSFPRPRIGSVVHEQHRPALGAPPPTSDPESPSSCVHPVTRAQGSRPPRRSIGS